MPSPSHPLAPRLVPQLGRPLHWLPWIVLLALLLALIGWPRAAAGRACPATLADAPGRPPRAVAAATSEGRLGAPAAAPSERSVHVAVIE